jgi:uncharacterized membrane protein
MKEARKPASAPSLTAHVANTVDTVAALHARAQRELGPHVRRISRMNTALGRPSFLVFVLVFVTAWVTLNLIMALARLVPPDPPPFAWLQGLLSLCALLTTIVVLITQNRQSRHIEQRARLDLQINLLAEQKVTKLIELVEELRCDMPNVRNRVDRVADEMKEPVDTEAVMSALDKTLETPRVSRPSSVGEASK